MKKEGQTMEFKALWKKEMILELLRENPKYIKEDLMKILNKGDGTIKGHLADLKKEGKLKRIGSTKAGYWKVIDGR